VLQTHLAEAGHALLAQAQRRVDHIHEQILTGLTDRDIQRIGAGLLHIATALENAKATTRLHPEVVSFESSESYKCELSS